MKEKIRILLADDNSEFVSTVIEYLKQEEDMEVIATARDGLEAYEKIKNLNPDVVLLDVIMPHMDGIGVLEKLNQDGKMVTCIMLSAVGQDKITAKAINLGAEYYIIKPFEIDLLIKRIRELRRNREIDRTSLVTREIKQNYIKH